MMLDKIRDFADLAHGEQKRKYTPDRYIVHPVRVMNLCKEYTNNDDILAAALLHDVLEDTPVTAEDIRSFLLPLMGKEKADHTLELVIELTDVYVKEKYPRLNRPKRKQMEKERMEKISADAQTIKYADILDNCKEIVRHDPSFARVFLKECKALLLSMKNGNTELYQRALYAIDDNLAELKKKRE